MPTNKTTTPLIGGNYYHIFNRGINRNSIFFILKNYEYFLSLWKKYLNDYVEVLAYSLLPNHFHFLIKIFEEIEIQDQNGLTQRVTNEDEIGVIVSEKLRRLFISFSQAINKQENKTGSLLTRNFKRIEIKKDSHLKYLFFYIHYNSQKHFYINDFREYKYSSYKAYILNKPTHVSKKHGLELFDGLEITSKSILKKRIASLGAIPSY